MKPTEVVAVVRLISAMCPAQKIDEYTSDAWMPLLEDVRFEDAQAALKNLGRELRFIAPSDICREVRRIRGQRLHDNPMPEPVAGMSVPEYLDWYRTTRTAIADGDLTTDPAPTIDPRIGERVLQQLGGGTFRNPDDVEPVKGEWE